MAWLLDLAHRHMPGHPDVVDTHTRWRAFAGTDVTNSRLQLVLADVVATVPGPRSPQDEAAPAPV